MSFNDLFSKEADIKKAAAEEKNKDNPTAETKNKENSSDQQGKTAD